MDIVVEVHEGQRWRDKRMQNRVVTVTAVHSDGVWYMDSGLREYRSKPARFVKAFRRKQP